MIELPAAEHDSNKRMDSGPRARNRLNTDDTRLSGRKKGNKIMKTHPLKVLVPGILAAAALFLCVGAGAQTTSTSPPPPSAPSPEANPMAGHHKHHASGAKHDAGMKAQCDAMMAKRQEMQGKLDSMDASLDALVAKMNAAQGSKDVDSLEKPMAAVLNELVAQRKATRTMMMEMQHEMMGHMMHHMKAHGSKGAMECPMMKEGKDANS